MEAKSNYQRTATEYAKEYLENLLDIENYLGRNIEHKIDQIVRLKLKKLLDENGIQLPPEEEDTEQKTNN